MKALSGIFFGSTIIVGVASLILSVDGLLLAFKASFGLGVLAFFLEPAPFALGLLDLLGKHDVARHLANTLGI